MLDLYAIIGLPSHAKHYSEWDYEDIQVNHQIDLKQHRPTSSYDAWVKHYMTFNDERGGLAFLELWWLKFLECSSTNKPTNVWTRMAKQLFHGTRINFLAIGTRHVVQSHV